MARPRRNDLLIPFLMVALDAIAILGAFVVAYHFRFSNSFTYFVPAMEGIPPLDAYVMGALIMIPFWLRMFKLRQVYKVRRTIDLSLELFQVIRVVSMGMLLVMSAAFFYRAFSYSRVVFVLIWVFSIAFIFLFRLVVILYEQQLYRRRRELKNVLIVGANILANNLAVKIHYQPTNGYNLVGYVTNADERIESVAAPRLGRVADIPHLVEEYRIEALLICLTNAETNLMDRILDDLTGKSIQILLQPEFLGAISSRIQIAEAFGIPFISVKDVPLTTWNRISKRAFDLVFSSIVLILTAPMCAIVSLLILLDSGRPIFYTQRRIGLDNREFDLFKFRTMAVDAEQETGPTWTRKNDPRVTRIGRFLRRTSFDEIPQFLNVLLGEMSVVGPRPERPVFVQQFQNYVPKYLERHRMKAGLTGWAQVNGLRGEAPISERTKYDIYYIENWSMKFDIRIIFKTIQAVTFGKDAY